MSRGRPKVAVVTLVVELAVPVARNRGEPEKARACQYCSLSCTQRTECKQALVALPVIELAEEQAKASEYCLLGMLVGLADYQATSCM